MSNKISRAARERMARTGEPYTLARRMVIEEHAGGRAAAEPEAAEPAALFGVAGFVRQLLAPLTSDGPPYTHVLRLPETEEEMAAAPLAPTHTVTEYAP